MPTQIELAALAYEAYGPSFDNVLLPPNWTKTSVSTNPASGFSASLYTSTQLTAEIVEDQRTVLEYLLSPVQRVASEAGRER